MLTWHWLMALDTKQKMDFFCDCVIIWDKNSQGQPASQQKGRNFVSPDRVTGERNSERLQAVEQLLLSDAWSQLMNIFLGWQRELMLAVSESTLKDTMKRHNNHISFTHPFTGNTNKYSEKRGEAGQSFCFLCCFLLITGLPCFLRHFETDLYFENEVLYYFLEFQSQTALDDLLNKGCVLWFVTQKNKKPVWAVLAKMLSGCSLVR